MKKLLEQYLKNITETLNRGDAREESYYKHLDELVKQYAEIQNMINENGAFEEYQQKYFEGVAPEVWSYHIGGYQVLQKYLKDRKGRNMEDAPHYCRIVTALSKTIEIQEQIDTIYPEVEKELVQF